MTSNKMLGLFLSMALLALCSAQSTDNALQEADEMSRVLGTEFKKIREKLQAKPQGENGDQSGKMDKNRMKDHGYQHRPYYQGGLGSPYSRGGLHVPGGPSGRIIQGRLGSRGSHGGFGGWRDQRARGNRRGWRGWRGWC